MAKAFLPIREGSVDEYYGPWPCGRDGADVQIETLVQFANLSGELAELVREGASADPLAWELWKEKAQGVLARFDAIAEVKHGR